MNTVPDFARAYGLKLAAALGGLDAWLESMRAPDGYSGPVMHWWESNFLYTGSQFDWRYEGIIDGYRELYLTTAQPEFLERAVRAAGDLLPNQLPDGRWRRSSFQFGPVAGGTPHEAALDVALLRLASTLATLGHDAAPYRHAAQRNIEGYWIGQLWTGQGFQDQPYTPVFVANKHATLIEALVEAETQCNIDYSEYIERCVDVVLGAQQHAGRQRGGTVHLGIGPSRLAIPLYTARSMNGLLAAYDRAPTAKVEAALSEAATFLMSLIEDRGVMWGVYGDGRIARNPVMVAGSGDVLRYLLRIKGRGLAEVDAGIYRLVETLLGAQRPSGALPTGAGFLAKGLSSHPRRQELRDVLPVVGWVDKAFRALALALPLGSTVPAGECRPDQMEMIWQGQRCVFHETPDAFRVTRGDQERYHWVKGEASPRHYDL